MWNAPTVPDLKRPWHEVIIDLWVANPLMKQGEIAKALGKTESWLSIVVNNDAFRMKYKERKAELVDPEIMASVDEKLKTVVAKASDALLKRLTESPAAFSVRDLNQTINATARAAGMGVASAPVMQQTLYVIPAPPPAKTVAEWQGQVAEEIAFKDKA